MYEFRHCSEITDLEILNNCLEAELIFYKKKRYLNIAASFDIETTNIKLNDKTKFAIMYFWGFDLNGLCCYGRTWEEFVKYLNRISKILDLNVNRRLIIYVHNLGFEFQFMRNWFTFIKVFAREKYKPIYCETNIGIDFRCSYFLSGYSLAKIAENLQTHKIKKLVGDLDYSLIRNSKTELDEKELEYCYNDIVIVEYYIKEQIEQNGDITKIPLTKTGYVRRLMRESMMKDKFVMSIVKELKIEDILEYNELKKCFMGGFTHSNALWVGEKVSEVHSIDLTSSYPTVMIAEKYPFSSPIKIEECSYKEYKEDLTDKLIISKAIFTHIQQKENVYENIISESKCLVLENKLCNNGRVVRSSYLETYITNIDFEMIEQFYDFEDVYFTDILVYEKAYLPKPIISNLLDLYHNKTMLKHVEGKEVEYLASKEMINSAYGMIVTDILPQEIIYDGEWKKGGYKENKLDAYNNSYNRFLYYPWGIFVTSYARRNVLYGILEMGIDYIYSDTDSLKFKNYEAHKAWIELYNKNIIDKLNNTIKHYSLDPEKLHPKGQQLGIWDYEGKYEYFKTLGAKRYIYQKDGELHITVAGVSKLNGAEYLKKLGDPFKYFNDELVVPEEYSGKRVITYNDEEVEGEITDYKGNTAHYHEKSSAYIGASSYSLNLSYEFANFLKGLKEENINENL